MQAGRTHPDACSPPCPHTPSGMGEKRGGKGVGKLTGQNQDKENTHQMLEKQTCLGDALARLPPPPPSLPTPCQLHPIHYQMPFNRKSVTP